MANAPVRIITTHEGRFLNVDDMKRALNDPGLQLYIASLLRVGQDKGESWQRVIVCACAGFVAHCAGDIKKPDCFK